MFFNLLTWIPVGFTYLKLIGLAKNLKKIHEDLLIL